MKAKSLLATISIVCSLTSHAADSCVWLGDKNNMHQLSAPANTITQNVTLSDVKSLAMEAKGCGVWSWSAAGLSQHADNGQVLQRFSLDQLLQRYGADAPAKAALNQIGGSSAQHALIFSPKDRSVWLGGGSGLLHIDAQGNLLKGLTLPSAVVDLALDIDQSIWVLTENELSHYAKSGALLSQFTLGGRYTGVQQIALDSVGDKLWLLTANQLWQFDLANLNQTTPVAPPAAWQDGLSYTAEQKVSHSGYIYQAISAHTAQIGAGWNPAATPSLWQRIAAVNPSLDSEAWLVGLTYQVGQFVHYKGQRYQALSLHTVYLDTQWTPDTTPSLWTPIGAATTAPVNGLLRNLPGTLQTASINSKTGDVWVLAANKLQSYSWKGELRENKDLSTLGIQNPKTLSFDAASQTFWLYSTGLATQFNAQSEKLAQIAINSERPKLGTTAFNLLPSVSIQSPVGVLNNATPNFAFTYGALCNEQPCGFESGYFNNYKITATLDGQTITGLQLNHSTQQANYLPVAALSNGAHKVTIQAVDQFGYASSVAEQSFFIDTIAPKFLGVTPATGSTVSVAQLNLSGSVDDPEALVSLNKAADFGVNTNNPAKGTFAWTLNLKPGLNTVELTAVDQAGNSTNFTASYTYNAAPPAAPVAAKISLGKVQNNAVSITAAAGAVGAGLKVSVINQRTNQTQQITATESGSFSASITAQAGDILTLFATDSSGTKSAEIKLTVAAQNNPPADPNVIPADPLTQAPKTDSTVPTRLAGSTEFLYTGANPIQTGVAPGTIEARRAAVLRGRVLDRDGNVLPGVKITILNHPEFGQTVSRANGLFDMVVNGGGSLTINYSKDGVLPAQRNVNTPWQEYVVAPTVALTTLDSQATQIQLNATEAQIARGSVVTDQDGSRQATLVIPQGTTATMKLPDGTTQALSSATVRASEYTVGVNGQKAMPGDLPASSGYTYAVELSLDEAMAAGATSVEFNQPVYSYVENFLGFPVGGIVPAGYYDRQKAAWIASENGRIIKVLNTDGGIAALDVDGNGVAADAARLAQLNINDAERQQLAKTYVAGTSLWRVPVKHFTPWDYNWPYGPPKGAEPPKVPEPKQNKEQEETECKTGSIIECQNQSLGESLNVTGTPFTLNYKSSRTNGGKPLKLPITLSDATLPASVKRIDLEINVAGRQFKQSFAATTNQSYDFVWDGLDAYGRKMQGAQKVAIRIGYVYPVEYKTPSEFGQSFATTGGAPITGGNNRTEVVMWQTHDKTLGTLEARAFGLGAWSLDVMHSYDPITSTMYFGNGSIRGAKSLNAVISTIVGNGNNGNSGDGGPALSASFNHPFHVISDRQGSLLIADFFNSKIRRVSPEGIVSTIAGNGRNSYSGDGGPAISASLYNPASIAIDSLGNILISEYRNHRIRKITPNGIISTIAGNGVNAHSGDGMLATEASLSGPYGITLDQFDNIYLAELDGKSIRKISPDGKISTIKTGLTRPSGIAVDQQGNIYVAEGNSSPCGVRRIASDGSMSTIAGNGSCSFSGDGGSATEASVNPEGVVVDKSGIIWIADTYNNRIRRVSSDGTITTIAGNGTTNPVNDGGSPTNASIHWPVSITLDALGGLLIPDWGHNTIRKVSATLGGYDVADIVLPSSDGSELYQFDDSGRHIATRSTSTKTELYRFGYDANGFVNEVKDANGNITRIERDASGKPQAIVAPLGQRTTLALDSKGYLASITNPAGEAHSMAYSNDGLLKTFTNPRNKTSTMTYENGLLVKDQNAAGGGWTLARTELGGRNYEVGMSSALNRTSRYRTEFAANGDTIKTTITPDGSSSISTEKTNGTTVSTSADGTISTSVESPDPRFGMLAPIQTSLSVRLPSGLQMQQSAARSVVLTNASDPLSLEKETNISTINGKTFLSVFDAIQKRVTSTSAANRTTVTQLDAQGRPLSVQQSGIVPLNYQYDARGRLENVSQGANDSKRGVSYTYNALGEVDTITDAVGRITKYGYDLAGRVKTITQPDSRVMAFSYDANGNVISVTPPTRPAHGFSFNDFDLASTYLPPELQVGQALNTQYEYNLDQQPTKVIRPDGKTIEYGYDEFGRLGALKSIDGQISYAYQAGTGQLASVTAGDVSQGYTYDGPLPKTISIAGPVPGNIGITYDNFFRVQQLSINGQNTSYGYDNDGLLTQAGALTLNHNAANGLLTGTTLDNITTEQEYDEFGQLKRLIAKQGSTVLFSETFTRDKLGRVEEKTTTTGGPVVKYRYAYDAAGRLSDVFKDGALQNHYEFDANGNRTQADGIAASYDAQDRLKNHGTASYGFSANGELQTVSTVDGTSNYTYDVYGNLKQVQLASGGQIDYLIDAQNRRIGKKINEVLTQGWVYQDQLKPIAELDGNGLIVSRFIYAGKANVPEYMIKGSTNYRLLTDTLGSVRQVVNSQTGQVLQELEYDAWGKVTRDSNPGFQPFGYAGGLYDNNTGLVRFGARDYDAKTARWTAKDPIGFNGGDSNIYGYVFNDPINNRDIYGLSACEKDDEEDCLQKALDSYSLEESLNDIVGFGVGSAVAGGGLQALNKTAPKTAEQSRRMIGGGGKSGDRTSYTRKWFGRASYGRDLGRTSIQTIARRAGILGAGVSAWMLHARAMSIYLGCLK